MDQEISNQAEHVNWGFMLHAMNGRLSDEQLQAGVQEVSKKREKICVIQVWVVSSFLMLLSLIYAAVDEVVLDVVFNAV